MDTREKQNRYIFFSESQKQRAVQTDLEKFLPLHGFELERSGKESRIKSDHSITVSGNAWYDHEKEQGGNPISLIQKLFNKNWQDAVSFLIDENGEPAVSRNIERKKAPFKLPNKNSTSVNAVSYLHFDRKIDKDIINFFIERNDIYENTMHSVVFVGRDKGGTPQQAHIRGTDDTHKFVMTQTDSDMNYNFCYRGKGNRLFVFEAPIDMLSYIDLHKDSWQESSYLALCGVSGKAVIQFLRDTPNINDIVFCLDNDTAGINADHRIESLVLTAFPRRDIAFSSQKSVNKDWNHDLKNRKNKSTSSMLKAKKLYEQLAYSYDAFNHQLRYHFDKCHCCCVEGDYEKALEYAYSMLDDMGTILGNPLDIFRQYAFSDSITSSELEEQIDKLLVRVSQESDMETLKRLQNKLAVNLFDYTCQIKESLTLSYQIVDTPEMMQLGETL